MKRVAIVLASLLLVLLLAGAASADGLRVYRATTSDGGVVRFRIIREDTRREIRFMHLDLQLDCDDGTTEPLGGGLSDWGWFFEGRTATVDETRPENWALHIVGTFRPASASGTLRYTVVMLNGDDTARLCTTGDATWTAERI